MLPAADSWMLEGKYPMIKVLRGCILKLMLIICRIGNMQFAILLLFVVCSSLMLIICRIGNMQFAILLSFVVCSTLPPRALQFTHPPIPSYQSIRLWDHLVVHKWISDKQSPVYNLVSFCTSGISLCSNGVVIYLFIFFNVAYMRPSP